MIAYTLSHINTFGQQLISGFQRVFDNEKLEQIIKTFKLLQILFE